MLLPLTNAQRCLRFGRFDFQPAPRPTNPEGIRILGGWAEKNIADVSCPQLARFDRSVVNVHHKAAPSFLTLWAAWEREGLLDAITTWNGSFVPRFKRGRAGGGIAALSNHSWGCAFDVCARQYPLGKAVPADAPIRQLVPIAERLGWFWGGHFSSRPDGMHFEFVGVAPAQSREEAARSLLAGGLTRAEVKAAQQILGLRADGIAGPLTMARAHEIVGA